MTREEIIQDSISGRGMPLETLKALDRCIRLRIADLQTGRSLYPVRPFGELAQTISETCDLLKSRKDSPDRRRVFNALVDGVAGVVMLVGEIEFLGVTYQRGAILAGLGCHE